MCHSTYHVVHPHMAVPCLWYDYCYSARDCVKYDFVIYASLTIFKFYDRKCYFLNLLWTVTSSVLSMIMSCILHSLHYINLPTPGL